IFCEPASAASFAGLVKMHRQGLDLHDKRIVCVCTGNGLKDPDLAVSSAGSRVVEVSANIKSLEAATLEFGD
ncbi:MAG: threonine synthase, partial [Dehalococcoidia bacterium]|nr:threonine synthase [Dehalococcoidia bacterium]